VPRGRLAGRPYPSTHHTTLGVEPRTAGRSTGGRRLALVVHRWAASLIAIAAPPCSVGMHSTIDDKIPSSPWAVNALRQAARAAVGSEERQDSGGSNRPPKHAPCVGWANDALLR